MCGQRPQSDSQPIAEARPAFHHPEAAGFLSEESKTTINKDNWGKLCEKLLCHADGAIKSGLPQRGGICCGAARPSPKCQEPLYPPNLTFFEVLPWSEKPFRTWKERVFWVNPVSQVPFTSSKLISNIKAEKYENSRGNRRWEIEENNCPLCQTESSRLLCKLIQAVCKHPRLLL